MLVFLCAVGPWGEGTRSVTPLTPRGQPAPAAVFGGEGSQAAEQLSSRVFVVSCFALFTEPQRDPSIFSRLLRNASAPTTKELANLSTHLTRIKSLLGQ